MREFLLLTNTESKTHTMKDSWNSLEDYELLSTNDRNYQRPRMGKNKIENVDSRVSG